MKLEINFVEKVATIKDSYKAHGQTRLERLEIRCHYLVLVKHFASTLGQYAFASWFRPKFSMQPSEPRKPLQGPDFGSKP